MRMRWRGGPGILAGLGIVTLLHGCGGAGDRTVMGTLAGPDVELGWTAEPVFAVGGVEAPEWAAFGEVTDLAFDAGGRLYVLDGQRKEVTVVSPSGGFLTTVGRPGEGPGELRFPQAIALHPDGRVAVYDPGHGGFVVYGGNGEFLHNVRVDPEVVPTPEPPLGVTRGGWIVSSNTVPDGDPPPARAVVAWSFDPSVPHRILHDAWSPPTPATEEPGPDLTGGLRIRLAPVVAFHPGLHVAPAPDGGVVVVDTTTWRIQLVGPEGGISRVLERPIAPVPVTDEIRGAERARRLAEAMEEPPRFMISSRDGGTAAAADEMVRRFLEARIEGMGFHDVVPLVERLGTDPAGRIWVERSGDWPGRAGPVDVVTADGAYLGTVPPSGVAMPDALGPDGLLAYRGADELGAPRVRVLRLVGEAPR